MVFRTEARVEWSVDHESAEPRVVQAAVTDADELERLLDRLTAQAVATQPLIAEFVTSNGARLGVGLEPQRARSCPSRTPTIRRTT